MTQDKIVKAMMDGWIFVCAMCEKFWEGRDLKLTKSDGTPRCSSNHNCGSPSCGGNFHDYSGPINSFEGFCYVCGKKSDYALVPKVEGKEILCKVNGSKRLIGVCEKHVKLVNILKPHGVGEYVDSVRKPEIKGR
jgi:hypothetical protein